MFRDDILVIAAAAKSKADFFHSSKLKYFIAAALAGLFVGFGVLAMSTVGGVLTNVGHPMTKLLNAFVFPVALSLVIFAGSELFTGNTFVMTVGVLEKRVSMSDLLGVWILAYIGNLAGSFLCAAAFIGTGLASGDTLSFILSTAQTKMTLTIPQLILRGILCNILVCLAVWCSNRMKSESGKLILIFWCIFTFVICGFEHSVANMTMLSLGVLLPHEGMSISVWGFVYNLLFVSLGNTIGGAVTVALPYYLIAKHDGDDRKQEKLSR